MCGRVSPLPEESLRTCETRSVEPTAQGATATQRRARGATASAAQYDRRCHNVRIYSLIASLEQSIPKRRLQCSMVFLSRMEGYAGMHGYWPSWGAWRRRRVGMEYLSRIILCIRAMERCRPDIHG